MNPSFALTSDPWIPCLLPGSGPPEMLGLHDTLDRSGEIRGISHASPLVTVALHRLLLAILHRNFGPEDAGAWQGLWERGEWDMNTLHAYLHRWHHRLDLFDSDHPFYQVASLDRSYAGPATKLTHELATGNNATLFDHTTENPGVSLTPAQAAQYLIAHHAFSVGGLVTFESGQDRSVYGSATGAPLAKGAVSLVKGESLFQTLMLNLHQYSRDNESPFPFHDDDIPAWERDEEVRAVQRYPSGYIDLLTWQSRRVRLYPSIEDGKVVVRHVSLLKGYQFPDALERRDYETMLAFRRNLQAKPGQEAWSVVTFREERALWRDSTVLFQAAEGTARPRTLTWLDELVHEGVLDRGTTLPIEISGLSTDRAKVLFWRGEVLPLPLRYLSDEDLLEKLRSALELAEEVGRLFSPGFTKTQTESGPRSFPRPLQVLAEGLYSPLDGRKPDQAAVARLIEHLAPGRVYWSRLELPFKQLLIDLAEDRTDEYGEVVYGARALPVWAQQVQEAARTAFNQATASLDSSARSLKAVARAQRAFNTSLRRTIEDRAVSREEITA